MKDITLRFVVNPFVIQAACDSVTLPQLIPVLPETENLIPRTLIFSCEKE